MHATTCSRYGRAKAVGYLTNSMQLAEQWHLISEEQHAAVGATAVHTAAAGTGSAVLLTLRIIRV